MKKLAIGMMVFCSLMALSVAAWCGDNGNGTVTIGNLVWLKDPGCLGRMNWSDAMSRPKSLADGQCGLTDKSKPGDWRLPTIDELKAIHTSKILSNMNVPDSYYWSSSTYTYAGSTSFAWTARRFGGVSFNIKEFYENVWPVRGGQ